MQTHEKEAGRPVSDRIDESSLEVGADFDKKEGGLRVLTAQGVKKVAEALRLQRQKAAVPPVAAEKVEIAEPAKKEAGGGEALPVMATARKHVFNQRRLLCDVEGRPERVSVLVRDSAFYRRGEQFEVRLNDAGEWEAALHRSRPKFQ